MIQAVREELRRAQRSQAFLLLLRSSADGDVVQEILRPSIELKADDAIELLIPDDISRILVASNQVVAAVVFCRDLQP